MSVRLKERLSWSERLFGAHTKIENLLALKKYDYESNHIQILLLGDKILNIQIRNSQNWNQLNYSVDENNNSI